MQNISVHGSEKPKTESGERLFSSDLLLYSLLYFEKIEKLYEKGKVKDATKKMKYLKEVVEGKIKSLGAGIKGFKVLQEEANDDDPEDEVKAAEEKIRTYIKDVGEMPDEAYTRRQTDEKTVDRR